MKAWHLTRKNGHYVYAERSWRGKYGHPTVDSAYLGKEPIYITPEACAKIRNKLNLGEVSEVEIRDKLQKECDCKGIACLPRRGRSESEDDQEPTGLLRALNVLAAHRYKDAELEQVARDVYEKVVEVVRSRDGLPRRKPQFAYELDQFHAIEAPTREQRRKIEDKLQKHRKTRDKYARFNLALDDLFAALREYGVIFSPSPCYSGSELFSGLAFAPNIPASSPISSQNGLQWISYLVLALMGWLKRGAKPYIRECRHCRAWFFVSREHKYKCPECS